MTAALIPDNRDEKRKDEKAEELKIKNLKARLADQIEGQNGREYLIRVREEAAQAAQDTIRRNAMKKGDDNPSAEER